MRVLDPSKVVQSSANSNPAVLGFHSAAESLRRKTLRRTLALAHMPSRGMYAPPAMSTATGTTSSSPTPTLAPTVTFKQAAGRYPASNRYLNWLWVCSGSHCQFAFGIDRGLAKPIKGPWSEIARPWLPAASSTVEFYMKRALCLHFKPDGGQLREVAEVIPSEGTLKDVVSNVTCRPPRIPHPNCYPRPYRFPSD